MKEVLDATLASIVGTEQQERASEYGERAWRVRGALADVIYWDVGNGWCDIMRIVPRDKGEAFILWLERFFDQIEACDDE